MDLEDDRRVEVDESLINKECLLSLPFWFGWYSFVKILIQLLAFFMPTSGDLGAVEGKSHKTGWLSTL